MDEGVFKLHLTSTSKWCETWWVYQNNKNCSKL